MINENKKYNHNRKFPAIYNGHKMTACKTTKGGWLVGGDFPLPTDDVLIITKSKKSGNRLAYFVLKGNRLIFNDYVGWEDNFERITNFIKFIGKGKK